MDLSFELLGLIIMRTW